MPCLWHAGRAVRRWGGSHGTRRRIRPYPVGLSSLDDQLHALGFGRVYPVPEILKRQGSLFRNTEHGLGKLRPMQLTCLEVEVPHTDIGCFGSEPERFKRFLSSLDLAIFTGSPKPSSPQIRIRCRAE